MATRRTDRRSGGTGTKHLYRSRSSSTGDHILFLTSGTTPNLRHQASGGGSITITSSVAIVNDTTWSTIVGTWRPGRLELYVDGWSRASSTAAATNTTAVFGIYRWGWGFSTSQDFNGDIALIACFASSWTPAMVRRWHADPFGFLRPWNEAPALFGSAPPATPPGPARAWSPLPNEVGPPGDPQAAGLCTGLRNRNRAGDEGVLDREFGGDRHF
jgi:Concanavalin A-like lectin/glucanases superfamily